MTGPGAATGGDAPRPPARRPARVLLHGDPTAVASRAERLVLDGALIDVLGKADPVLDDLVTRGVVSVVTAPDPWAYDTVERCTAAQGPAPAPAAVSTTGRVVLVGAGPGDPGLITVDALAALYAADVVVTDRLAPLSLLDRLPHDPQIIHVGKIPRGAFTPQESINELLLSQAREGRTVVRFKGGDGYVLGRGREEYDACVAAGIPVEVVPGVSSAIAVPAAAGIPVTERAVSQGFVVVSGHVPPGDPRCDVAWDALATCGLTLVVLMGVGNLPRITASLMDAGLSAQTPAAVVENGTQPQQRTVRAPLADIASRALAADVRPPAVVVIGQVAAERGA